jgi:hypothetical protein
MALNIQEELSSETMFCIYGVDYPNMMMSLAQTTPLMRNGMKYHRTQYTACAHDPNCQFHPSPLFRHPPYRPLRPSRSNTLPSRLAPTSPRPALPPIPSGTPPPQTSPSAPPSCLATRLTHLALICIHNVVECTCPPICPDRPTAKRTCSPIRSMDG